MSILAKETELESGDHSSNEDSSDQSFEQKVPLFGLHQIVWVKVKGHPYWPGTVSITSAFANNFRSLSSQTMKLSRDPNTSVIFSIATHIHM